MKTFYIKNKDNVCKIDDSDFNLISKHLWRMCGGYARTSIKQKDGKWKSMFMHKMILKTPKGKFIDHIDHNRLNNTRKNLRFCTPVQNQQNKIKGKSNTSGYKGVCLRKRSGTYEVMIRIKSKKKFVGCFKDPIEGARAYDRYARKYFKKFALLNFKVDKYNKVGDY